MTTQRVFHRYKNYIGYIVLAVGLVVALAMVVQYQEDATSKDKLTRGVICQNTITNDRQQLTNLITKAGHELISRFGLTLPQAAVLVRRQLEASAQERQSLQPSDPASACTDKLTTLKINPPKVSKASEAALATAEKRVVPPPAPKAQRPKAPPASHTPARTPTTGVHSPRPRPKGRARTIPAPEAPAPSRPRPPSTQPQTTSTSTTGTTSTAPETTPTPTPTTPTPGTTPTPVPLPVPVPKPPPPVVKIPPITVGPVTTPEIRLLVPLSR